MLLPTQIDHSASKSFLGFIVASFSFGQLVTSPLIGMWSNYRPIKEPLIITLLISTGGYLMYAYAGAFEHAGKWVLITSRFIMGLAAGNIALARSYMAAATMEAERNTAMSLLASMQALGFILGPAIGLLFQPLGEDGVEWSSIKLYFNLYTGPGFLGAILSIINILMVIFLFKEYNLQGIKRRLHLSRLCCYCVYKGEEHRPLIDREVNGEDGGRDDPGPLYHYDHIAAWSSIIIFFLVLIVFAVIDTLLTPMAEDEYGWSGEKATFVVNLLSAINAVLSVLSFMSTRFILKCVPERVVFIGGLILMIVGMVIWLPLGPDKPPIQMTDVLSNYTGDPLDNSTSKLGCDYHKQSWCLDQPKIYLFQYVVGLYILTPGYCASSLICYTMFSKILGPRPQGLMMGFISAAGSAGRTAGPLLLANVYYTKGPRTTFIMCIGIISVALATLLIFYRRMIPYSTFRQKHSTRLKLLVNLNSDSAVQDSAIIDKSNNNNI
ncbi:major facilitator superfamily domain-containing protein 8-like isoform X2 [Dysidea avara]|uniref:major facilitator superfamily domain-containing protein 8-like isoform X2 n=1 Tax=Dysidea avara TaxID=196820 RepID=UPI00331EE070